jgi:hypothetical protein
VPGDALFRKGAEAFRNDLKAPQGQCFIFVFIYLFISFFEKQQTCPFCWLVGLVVQVKCAGVRIIMSLIGRLTDCQSPVADQWGDCNGACRGL